MSRKGKWIRKYNANEERNAAIKWREEGKMIGSDEWREVAAEDKWTREHEERKEKEEQQQAK